MPGTAVCFTNLDGRMEEGEREVFCTSVDLT